MMETKDSKKYQKLAAKLVVLPKKVEGKVDQMVPLMVNLQDIGMVKN